MKVGLIGRGSISYAHMAAYDRMKAEQKDVEIVACCDIRPEQMDDMGDVRKYTNIDTFLEAEKGNLDYVDICLPTYLHAEVSIKAMKKLPESQNVNADHLLVNNLTNFLGKNNVKVVEKNIEKKR